MKIKKIIASIFAITMTFSSVSYFESVKTVPYASAFDIVAEEEKTYGIFTYIKSYYDDNIKIIECDKNAKGVIDIPAEIEGLPVTEVKGSTFVDCKGITSINVPASVEYIHPIVFNVKSNFDEEVLLESINVDEENQYYSSEDGILFNKDKTEIVYYPPAKKGTAYEIPETVEIIMGAFLGNQNLETVTISKNVENTVIAFYHCSKLKEVNIEYGVKNIGLGAFADCSLLEDVKIPLSVDSIDAGAFVNCTSLKKIDLSEVRIIDSDNSSKDYGAFTGCTNLSEITFSENIRYIGRDVFKDTLWYENQPDGMIYINNIAYRFKGTAKEKTFNIKEGTEYISAGAFEDVKNIESIVVPESVVMLEGYEFIYCDDLQNVTVLNPECDVYYILVDDNTFPDIDYPSIFHGTITGYEGSKAQEYAKEQENEFISLGEYSGKSGIKGDANNDGVVDVADVVAISAYVGDAENNKLDEQGIKNADVHNTGDGITANDALMVQQYLAKIVDTL